MVTELPPIYACAASRGAAKRRKQRRSPLPFSAGKRTLGITLATDDRLRSDEQEQKFMCEALIFALRWHPG